jgi:hypothetical protein
MNPLVPTISGGFAGLLALFGCALTARVIVNRVRTGIQVGDGGDAGLGQAIRAHANFAEQTPLALVVLVLAETLGAPAMAIYALGSALLVARGISAWGLSRSLGASPQRQAGAGLTLLVIAAASLLLLYRIAMR